jgi:hypothetical protein
MVEALGSEDRQGYSIARPKAQGLVAFVILMALGLPAGKSPFASRIAAGHLGTTPEGRSSRVNQHARSGSTPAKRPSGTTSVLFEVAAEEKGAFSLFPVVLIRGGRLVAPPSPDPSVDEYTPAGARFAARYYRRGKSYRLLFGGAEAAVLRVVRDDRDTINFTATAQPTSRFSLRGPKAIATDSATLGHGPGSRRAPTAAERKQALAIATRIYRRHGLSAPLVEKMGVVNLTAGDLDGDGRGELIGSFQVMRRDAAQNLFLILEPQASGFRSALVKYHPSRDPEMGADAEEQVLVDWLDLDGDGIAEVITESTYYESWDYAIYRKKKGAWRMIYQGGGGGV